MTELTPGPCTPVITEYDKQRGEKLFVVRCYEHGWAVSFNNNKQLAVEAVAMHIGKEPNLVVGDNEMPKFNSIEEADAWADAVRAATPPPKKKAKRRR